MSNIVLNKRGFAFVDLQDNVALDKAIEKLSGMKINGKEISVEHSGILRFSNIFCYSYWTPFDAKTNLLISVPRTSRTRKVQIRNIPSSMNWEDLDSLLSKFGRVESCEQVSTECESATVNVVYASRQVCIYSQTLKTSLFIILGSPSCSPRFKWTYSKRSNATMFVFARQSRYRSQS